MAVVFSFPTFLIGWLSVDCPFCRVFREFFLETQPQAHSPFLCCYHPVSYTTPLSADWLWFVLCTTEPWFYSLEDDHFKSREGYQQRQACLIFQGWKSTAINCIVLMPYLQVLPWDSPFISLGYEDFLSPCKVCFRIFLHLLNIFVSRWQNLKLCDGTWGLCNRSLHQ